MQDTPKLMNTLTPYLMPEDIENLPEELLNELRLSDSDKADINTIKAINLAGGQANLDKILVALYHITGQIEKRGKLASRINYMCTKGIIGRTKTGIYTTDLSQVNKNLGGDGEHQDGELGEAPDTPDNDANFEAPQPMPALEDLPPPPMVTETTEEAFIVDPSRNYVDEPNNHQHFTGE